MFPVLLYIPDYNDEKRLPVQEYIDLLSNMKEGVDIQFVNDGSRDGTQRVLLTFKNKFPKRIFIKELKNNIGKAEALRAGILKPQIDLCNYKYVGYFDADLAAPLEELRTFRWWFEKLRNEPLIIIGSRVKLLGTTHIKRHIIRH